MLYNAVQCCTMFFNVEQCYSLLLLDRKQHFTVLTCNVLCVCSGNVRCLFGNFISCLNIEELCNQTIVFHVFS